LNRYEFLTELHRIVKPKVYLETGVQYGASLDLAHAAEVAIGIDPNPLTAPHGNQVIMSMTSDQYFMSFKELVAEPIDMAFIDGMHLHEYALRDFKNIERHARTSSVVVFDDMLPYNQAIAAREQPPGDWTGDVWKAYYVLTMNRPDLNVLLVDTLPTGTMVVTDLDPDNWEALVTGFLEGADTVPDEIINRTSAVDPWTALTFIQGRTQ